MLKDSQTTHSPYITERAVELARVLYPDGWGFVEIETIKDALEEVYQEGRKDESEERS